jgi:TATA-box binding protein (TBP) (component of TFIID and TFIIIB)
MIFYLAFEINIAKLADSTNSVKHDSYPGLIYFMKNPVKSVSIFPSGKLILLGAKKI